MKLFLISVFVQDIGIISINIINMLNRRRNTVNDKKKAKECYERYKYVDDFIGYLIGWKKLDLQEEEKINMTIEE